MIRTIHFKEIFRFDLLRNTWANCGACWYCGCVYTCCITICWPFAVWTIWGIIAGAGAIFWNKIYILLYLALLEYERTFKQTSFTKCYSFFKVNLKRPSSPSNKNNLFLPNENFRAIWIYYFFLKILFQTEKFVFIFHHSKLNAIIKIYFIYLKRILELSAE